MADEKQQLDEADGNDAADHPQGGIEEELDGVDELIGGDVKQRFVAEQQVEHDPRGGRAQHDGTQHRRVEIAHHLLEREKDRRDGRVEGRRQGRGSSDGHQRPDPFRSQSQPPAEDRCQTRSNLDRRAFAAQRDAGCQRDRTAEEFPDHRPKADEAVAQEQCGFGLRDSAAARVGEIAGEQIPGEESAGDRDGQPPPGRAARRVHPGTETLGDVDEGRDHQADHGPDDQSQDEEELYLRAGEAIRRPTSS